MAEFDVFDEGGNVDREKLARTQSAAEELIDRADEVRGIDPSTRQESVTLTDTSVSVTSGRPLLVDPDSGANVTFDDGAITASGADDGLSARGRFSAVTADSGDLAGPLKFSAHGPEAEGFVAASDERTGIGGHLDVAGADVQVGDTGTHVKGGVSVGVGLGFEFIKGEDADGDGKAEFGLKGEGGPFSAEVKFEPDDVVQIVNESGDDFASALADPGASLQGHVDAAQTALVDLGTAASQFSIPDAAERVGTAGSQLIDDNPLNAPLITIDDATDAVQQVRETGQEIQSAAQGFIDSTVNLAGETVAFDEVAAPASLPTFSTNEATPLESGFNESQTVDDNNSFDD